MSRFARIRRQICADQCPAKCPDYLAGRIDHDAPESSCPVAWPGRWSAVSGVVYVPPDEARLSTAAREDQGRHAWETLHRHALADRVSLAWISAAFEPLIPRYGCTCLSDWRTLLAAHPFRGEDPFAWSVDVHNAVNAKLGKPQLTVDAARSVWSPPAQGASTAPA
jgi:hypothetical protein